MTDETKLQDAYRDLFQNLVGYFTHKYGAYPYEGFSLNDGLVRIWAEDDISPRTSSTIRREKGRLEHEIFRKVSLAYVPPNRDSSDLSNVQAEFETRLDIIIPNAYKMLGSRSEDKQKEASALDKTIQTIVDSNYISNFTLDYDLSGDRISYFDPVCFNVNLGETENAEEADIAFENFLGKCKNVEEFCRGMTENESAVKTLYYTILSGEPCAYEIFDKKKRGA